MVSKPLLPILDHFLFEISGNNLKVTSTDLETSMITQLQVEADEDINVAVPSRLTMDTLKNLPNQPVTFTVDDKNNIEIKSEFGRYKLTGQNADDFPSLPEIDSPTSFELGTDILLDCISKSIFATGNDDLRLNLTGVYVEMNNDYLTFVATDANRLVRVMRMDISPGTESSFILPKKALNLLKSTLAGAPANVEIQFNETYAYFKFDSTQLICRLIDDKYPDYNAVIPNNNDNELVIERSDLFNSLKRSSIYANKTSHQIRLKITGSELVISAEDVDLSNEAQETLSCEYEGKDMEIGFNSKLLMEMIANMDTTKVKLTFSEPNRAGLLYPVDGTDGEDLLMLIMPMMINAD